MERNYCFNCAWMRFSPMDPMGCAEFYVCTNPHLQKPEERDPVTGDLLAAATTERLCAALRSDAEDPLCPHYRKAAPVENPDQLPPVVRVEQLEALNREMLAALEFCCRRTIPGADCWCQIKRGLLMDGKCSEESTCPVWQAIQNARGH